VIVLKCTLFALAIYLSSYVLYNAILFFAHFVLRDPKLSFHAPSTRFAIIIPAHNEELLLERILISIREQNYPKELYKTIVVADNCVDQTAFVASRNSALVMERVDAEHVGKGYAIKYALESITLENFDAVFVVDADSRINCDALMHLNEPIEKGIDAIQCYNGVSNSEDSWFTRLLDVSRTISNEIFHPAKMKLGLSSYLMGNGMCFSRKFLQKCGWNAFTVGEDWEFYTKIIQAGKTVAFSNKARVYHQESSSLKQATTQRMRWSSGRFEIARKYGFRLFFQGLREGNIIKIDGSLPLLFPNPSLGMNLTLIGLMASIVVLFASGNKSFAFWYISLFVLQLVIFVAGILYTKNKIMKLLSLFVAPIFLTWKLGIDMVSMLGFGTKKWIRTERKASSQQQE